MGKAEEKPPETSTEESPEKPQVNEEKVEDVESLRKVIKLDDAKEENNENKQDDQSSETEENVVEDLIEDTSDSGAAEPAQSRDSLEQKRALLQRMKDFDLQIKKNQQDINDAVEKITSISKDLDDLVSLYEIVSEQMNPFVGLSKVTKKRLESFESINKEIAEIKNKISNIETTGGSMLSSEPEKLFEESSYPAEEGEIEPSSAPEESLISVGLSDQELNQIIQTAFTQNSLDNQIDQLLDEYIETLKA